MLELLTHRSNAQMSDGYDGWPLIHVLTEPFKRSLFSLVGEICG